MITVYGKNGCSACEITKSVLTKNKIEFEYKKMDDIDSEEYAFVMDSATKACKMSMPIIIENNNITELKDLIERNK